MDQALQAGPQPPQPIPDGIPGMLLAVLPDGWRLIGRCRFGTAGPVGPASGCHALAHPGIGLALVDVAPDATPNAEARLRRALGAANFWHDFPGSLPVWHDRIEIGAARNLPGLMAEGFSTLPPLTVPGKGAWIEAARQALAADAAWEVPGQPPRRSILPPPPPVEDDEEEGPPVRSPVRRRGRWKAAGLAVGLVLLAGLVWLVSAPLPPPPVQVAAAVIPEAPRPLPVEPEPPLPQLERVVVALPAPVVVPPPPVVAVPQPVEPAEVVPEAPAAPQLEEVMLALPPPAPPPAPPLRRVATPPRIDPGCTRALYRYQQGLPLSAAEAAHVRNGCATRR